MRILILAQNFHTISGGDKIFTLLARAWSEKNQEVTVLTNQRGSEFCEQNGIDKRLIEVTTTSRLDKFGPYVSTLANTLIGLFRAFTLPSNFDVIFSSSDTWPDTFGGLIFKLKNWRSKWISCCYLLVKHENSVHPAFRLAQRLALKVIRTIGDGLIIASIKDTQYHISKNLSKKRIYVIRGVIDWDLYQDSPNEKKVHDCIFVGRFHRQKNILELLDIFRLVNDVRKNTDLLLVGKGPEEQYIRDKVRELGLEKQVKLLGVLDGKEKIKKLKRSKLFVSASNYDSGNMALDESLASGTPGMVYNLPEMSFPRGVIKVPCFNKQKFANLIVSILDNAALLKTLSKEGKTFAKTQDYRSKAEEVLNFINKL